MYRLNIYKNYRVMKQNKKLRYRQKEIIDPTAGVTLISIFIAFSVTL